MQYVIELKKNGKSTKIKLILSSFLPLSTSIDPIIDNTNGYFQSIDYTCGIYVEILQIVKVDDFFS